MPMLPEKELELLAYLLFRLQLVLLCSCAHLFQESVHMQIISNYPPGHNLVHVFLAVDMVLLMFRIINKGTNNSADFRGFFSPERRLSLPFHYSPRGILWITTALSQAAVTSAAVGCVSASANLPPNQKVLNSTEVNEHFHLGGKTGALVASVCCFTCTRGCAWWWHGRWCSSAPGPLSSRRKCAAWDKPPCRLSGSNSHPSGPGWFCCLWVLGWWILFLEKTKQGNAITECHKACRFINIPVSYLYCQNDFIQRLTGKSTHALHNPKKWGKTTHTHTPHVPLENAWDLGKYTNSHSGRDLKVQYVVFGTKRKNFIDLSFTQLKKSKSSNTHCSFDWQQISWHTHHKHRATPTACWPLSRSQLRTGTSRHLDAGPPRCSAWQCARGWSAPSGYVR